MQGEERSISSADRYRFEQMLEAARDALTMASNATRDELDTHMMLRRATIQCVMVSGEAAARLSAEGRQLLPQLPWGQIVQTRNFLVHVYWGIDLDVIWLVASERVKELIAAIEPLLADPKLRESDS